jgi:hypothetical protein
VHSLVPIMQEGVGILYISLHGLVLNLFRTWLFLNQMNFLRARILVSCVLVVSEHGGYIFKFELLRIRFLGPIIWYLHHGPMFNMPSGLLSNFVLDFRWTFGFIFTLNKTFNYLCSLSTVV